MLVARAFAPALAGISALVAMTGAPRRAVASCVPQDSGLLWSYPANGALDVPIDADLIVTGDVSGRPTLNGVQLTMLEQGVYDLGELAAATRYEVRWETAVIGFETASERTLGSPPSWGAPDLVFTRNQGYERGCGLVPPQGCFDTGPPTTLTMRPPTSSVAWLVDLQRCDGSVYTFVVPSACGAPFIQSEDRIVCARLRAANGATISAPTDLFCSVPDVPLETIPRSSACTGEWPPADALTIASAAGASVTGDGQSSESSPAGADEVGCGLSVQAENARAGTGVLALAAAAIAASRRRARRTARLSQR